MVVASIEIKFKTEKKKWNCCEYFMKFFILENF